MNTFMQIEQATVENQQENTYEAGYDAAMADAAIETLEKDFNKYYDALQMMHTGNISDGAVEALSIALGAPVEAVSSLAAIEEDGILKKMKDAVVNFIKGIIKWIKNLFRVLANSGTLVRLAKLSIKLSNVNGVIKFDELIKKANEEKDADKKSKALEHVELLKVYSGWLSLDHTNNVYKLPKVGDIVVDGYDRKTGDKVTGSIKPLDQIDPDKWISLVTATTEGIDKGRDHLKSAEKALAEAKKSTNKDEIAAAKAKVLLEVRILKGQKAAVTVVTALDKALQQTRS